VDLLSDGTPGTANDPRIPRVTYSFSATTGAAGDGSPYTTCWGKTLVSHVGVDVHAAASEAAARLSAILVFMVSSFAVGWPEQRHG
jgi:hypothetical protein